MEFYATPITLLLLSNALILTLLGFYLFFARQQNGAVIYAVLMFSIAIWALFGAAENASVELTNRITFAKLSYIGILASGPLWLLFTLKYTNVKKTILRTTSLLALIIYILFAITVLTNDYHNLLWDRYNLIGENVINGVIFGHGPIWYANVVYQYFMIMAGVIISIKAAIITSGRKRRFLLLIVLATLIPWVCNLIYIISGGQDLAGVDLAPISFAVSGIIIAFSVFRYRYFSTISSAIEYIYHSIDVGIIVFDNNNRLISFNKTAEKDIGKNLEIHMPIKQVDEISNLPINQTVVVGKKNVITKNQDGKWLELNSDQIDDDEGKIIGHAITIYNIDKQIISQHKLDEQITRLSKTNELMVGRELKMIELKKQIIDLSKSK